MPKGYSLCVFDFSGCGKSEGLSVTYGMKEKHDIGNMSSNVESVLNILRFRYSRFVLWGRSMGAVSALLYAITYNNPSDVTMLVLDSPFSSFETISR
jgi:pimeloyl-ACP methyl ester carboxylesterase